MTTARYLVGDVFDRLAEIPDGSVDLVMTSPPFLALRSYLPAGHPDKGKEIGQEPSPAAFIDTLLALTAEWRRVLAPHGSIAVELGDTYSGSGGAGAASAGNAADRQYQGSGASKLAKPGTSSRFQSGAGWPLAKSLTGIPTLYAWSLAYGRNLLTGVESPAGMWRVRNVVAWCRPNPPVGALGDKFRPATSYLTIACVSSSRYFDLDAVRTPLTDPGKVQRNGGARKAEQRDWTGKETNEWVVQNPAGAPPLDWWEIPTQPYSGSHYATFPEALVVRPIEAMCPRKVCRTCGKPSERIVETERVRIADGTVNPPRVPPTRDDAADGTTVIGMRHAVESRSTTVGWTDCGHDDWRPGLVLDPFAGSGTTLAVAVARGRDAIGIDLDERNLDLARDRIGMWMEATG